MHRKILSTTLAVGFAVTSATVAADDVEISEMDTIVFCNSHKSGRIREVREYGVNKFGSLDAFYKNLHRVQCPPYYPSPLSHSIEEQPYERELITELENIGKYLTLEERQNLLNRPDGGRRKVTILDMVDIYYKRSDRDDFEEKAGRYEIIRQKLVELGAKRLDEMTPEERARYD